MGKLWKDFISLNLYLRQGKAFNNITFMTMIYTWQNLTWTEIIFCCSLCCYFDERFSSLSLSFFWWNNFIILSFTHAFILVIHILQRSRIIVFWTEICSPIKCWTSLSLSLYFIRSFSLSLQLQWSWDQHQVRSINSVLLFSKEEGEKDQGKGSERKEPMSLFFGMDRKKEEKRKGKLRVSNVIPA